jgi:demethylmenaquinone methyltransferase/2-methoxy-6-polyprenyl-1,4-benzoquinol methylase
VEDLSRTFGSQSVSAGERERKIRGVFDAVAGRYDLMNDLMSFGIHRLWKRTLARLCAPAARQLIVDLAGGTGDIAARVAAPDRTVVVCDPSLAMMRRGRKRVPGDVVWIGGTGERIPLAPNSADAVTISFGIRNVTDMSETLEEILRILKPGGRFLCLEFSRPSVVVRPFYHLFSAMVIPRLGAWIARAPDAYGYLVESIRRFPNQEEMKALIERAGYVNVDYRNLSFGIACIHTGAKPG